MNETGAAAWTQARVMHLRGRRAPDLHFIRDSGILVETLFKDHLDELVSMSY